MIWLLLALTHMAATELGSIYIGGLPDQELHGVAEPNMHSIDVASLDQGSLSLASECE